MEQVYRLTPEGKWDPNTEVYADNEENMIDYDGNVRDEQDRPMQIILANIEEDPELAMAASVSCVESRMVDHRMEASSPIHPTEPYISSMEAMSVCDPHCLSWVLSEWADQGRFMASIGSTNARNSRYLVDDDPEDDDDWESSDAESIDKASVGNNDGSLTDFIEDLNLSTEGT